MLGLGEAISVEGLQGPGASNSHLAYDHDIIVVFTRHFHTVFCLKLFRRLLKRRVDLSYRHVDIPFGRDASRINLMWLTDIDQ